MPPLRAIRFHTGTALMFVRSVRRHWPDSNPEAIAVALACVSNVRDSIAQLQELHVRR